MGGCGECWDGWGCQGGNVVLEVFGVGVVGVGWPGS